MNAPVKVDAYPLPAGDLAKHGIAATQIDHLDALIKGHIGQRRYPGAQIALARNGELLLFRSYGKTTAGTEAQPVNDRTLFQMFSQTKVFTSATVWTLIEEGKLSFMDKVADHLPEFAERGKADITLHQVMSHTGGFPSGNITEAAWFDHKLMRKEVCDFSLDWTPGTRLQYHPRAAHLVQAMVIEAVTGKDYRDAIRERVTEPLGIADDVFVGVPETQDSRCVMISGDSELRDNRREVRAAGLPGGGGYGTARGIVAFYQALLNKGTLHGRRILSPRLIAYVARNQTGEMPDAAMGGIPMHRGLGPHLRGESDRIRGLGTIGAPSVFGHGGAGSSYSWADPTSGVSFTYMTNHFANEPFHSLRLDRVANIIHAAID
ncbi:serine hydrolase domain-containing protein [Bradyrhizobium sp. LHD-71]|uniref:serine hydrolase domain-containing protein n=1 Tax=Bradyrhizobium sp. LHD-71 TaxID=3072141 RepID=UPI00280D14C0|nr:serine hydrolase domain-containing protein [Bradyrhizobium sp. LHD-71]MDQ8728397.1 serine hydrolase domain-containing protein [Bradyrhizobium sp. LHD-71]